MNNGASPEKLIFGAHEKPLFEQNQPKAYADLTKLKYLTNWKPSLSIEEGIKQTINENKWLINLMIDGIPFLLVYVYLFIMVVITFKIALIVFCHRVTKILNF